MLCIVVLLASGFAHYTGFADGARDVVFHLLFIHNWFGVTNASIDGVMWSLGVEIQFYVLFPLLVLAFVRRPLTTTFALFAIANVWRIWCMLSPDHYYYEQRLAQLPGYIDFFAAGMLGAYAYVAIALAAARAGGTALDLHRPLAGRFRRARACSRTTATSIAPITSGRSTGSCSGARPSRWPV